VPFESVSFIKYTTDTGTQIIAANTDFFSSIKQAFEKHGFAITKVFPIEVFGEDISNGINIDTAVKILGKVDSMKQYNLLQQHEVILPVEKKSQNIPEKKSQSHLYILIGVFTVLGVLLAVMLLLQK
jgi:hypothetical protein